MGDRFVEWMSSLPGRFGGFIRHHLDLLRDPETIVGGGIVALWAMMAGAWGGPIGIGVFLLAGLLLHVFAVESGNHVLLWLLTSVLLILIVVASQTLLGGLAPVLLATAGASALAHNELVRINYTRRRNAIVHDEVFQASGLGLAAASAIGIIGIALTEVLAGGGDRNWLWMPIGVGALMLVGFGLALGPARRSVEANRERWQPGHRIPPQPLPQADPDHHHHY